MVYVVQVPKSTAKGFTPNLQSALQYGPISYVFQGEDQPELLPGPALNKAKNALKDFDPDKDYILWPNIGSPAALVSCLLALNLANLSSVQMLHWNRDIVPANSGGKRSYSTGHYTPVKFELRDYLGLSNG